MAGVGGSGGRERQKIVLEQQLNSEVFNKKIKYKCKNEK